MSTMVKRSAAALLVAAAAAAIVVGGRHLSASPQALSPNSGPVIVRVNGMPVYLSELKARVQGIESIHKGATVQAMLGSNWREELLQSLETNAIIMSEARTRHLTVSPLDVTAAMVPIAQQFSSQSQLESWMRSQGMDYADFYRRIILGLVSNQVYLAVTQTATVGKDQVLSYWKKHQSDYVQSGQPAAFLTVRDQIQQQLLQDARKHMWGTWLDGQLKQANVQVVTPDWWKEI